MQAVRFELTKRNAQDLKPCPFDRSGTLAFDTIWSLSIWGLEPQALRLEALRAIQLRYVGLMVSLTYYKYKMSLNSF